VALQAVEAKLEVDGPLDFKKTCGFLPIGWEKMLGTSGMMLSGIGYSEEVRFLVAQVEQQHQPQLAGKIATGPSKSHRNPSGVCTCRFPRNYPSRRFSRRYWSLLPRACTTSCASRWFQTDEAVLLLGWRLFRRGLGLRKRFAVQVLCQRPLLIKQTPRPALPIQLAENRWPRVENPSRRGRSGKVCWSAGDGGRLHRVVVGEASETDVWLVSSVISPKTPRQGGRARSYVCCLAKCSSSLLAKGLGRDRAKEQLCDP
jgi:hypothetical protein